MIYFVWLLVKNKDYARFFVCYKTLGGSLLVPYKLAQI